MYWKRATSSGETAPTISRGTSPTWDTGTDTCFSGFIFVVRGCAKTGDPYDAVTNWLQVGYTQALPGVTVNGPQRTAVSIFSATATTPGYDFWNVTSKWRGVAALGGNSPSTTTGVDNGTSLYWQRDVDATLGNQSAGGYMSPPQSPHCGRQTTISFKPEIPFTAKNGLIIPSNQAVRRAANW
jgi:hypothetical protein